MILIGTDKLNQLPFKSFNKLFIVYQDLPSIVKSVTLHPRKIIRQLIFKPTIFLNQPIYHVIKLEPHIIRLEPLRCKLRNTLATDSYASAPLYLFPSRLPGI